MTYSSRILTLQESPTIAISQLVQELKAKGKDILSFSIGELDFDTPKAIKDEAIRAINSGFTKYTQTAGIPELRAAISNKLKAENALSYEPDEIVVSNGAKHSLFNVFSALVDSGDEVIIPAPYWVTYPELVRYCGGKSVIVETLEDNDFKITPIQLKAAISEKTKLLVLTSPSNPTGMVYSREELLMLCEIIKESGIAVISDEIYEKLIYDGAKFTSIGSLDGMLERTITINGLSKSMAMTGWRVGYAASKDKKLIKLLGNLQSQSTSNVNSIAQRAAIYGLNNDTRLDVEGFLSAFTQRRNLATRLINNIPSLEVKSPQGAFYLFINIQKINADSMAFCKDLLEKEGVALVPGVAFGMDGFVRFSFACSEEQIEQGIQRISQYIAKLR